MKRLVVQRSLAKVNQIELRAWVLRQISDQLRLNDHNGDLIFRHKIKRGL
jgi:hypothetical protein